MKLFRSIAAGVALGVLGVSATLTLTSPALADAYKGVVAAYDIVYYATGDTSEGVIDAARVACEAAGHTNCSQGLAVSMSGALVGLRCAQDETGLVTLGGSRHNMSQALASTLKRADEDGFAEENCEQFGSW